MFWKGAVTLFCEVRDVASRKKTMNFEDYLREKHTEATYEASELFQQELNTRRQGRHWTVSNASSAQLVGGVQMSWRQLNQRDS